MGNSGYPINTLDTRPLLLIADHPIEVERLGPDPAVGHLPLVPLRATIELGSSSAPTPFLAPRQVLIATTGSEPDASDSAQVTEPTEPFPRGFRICRGAGEGSSLTVIGLGVTTDLPSISEDVAAVEMHVLWTLDGEQLSPTDLEALFSPDLGESTPLAHAAFVDLFTKVAASAQARCNTVETAVVNSAFRHIALHDCLSRITADELEAGVDQPSSASSKDRCESLRAHVTELCRKPLREVLGRGLPLESCGINELLEQRITEDPGEAGTEARIELIRVALRFTSTDGSAPRLVAELLGESPLRESDAPVGERAQEPSQASARAAVSPTVEPDPEVALRAVDDIAQLLDDSGPVCIIALVMADPSNPLESRAALAGYFGPDALGGDASALLECCRDQLSDGDGRGAGPWDDHLLYSESMHPLVAHRIAVFRDPEAHGVCFDASPARHLIAIAPEFESGESDFPPYERWAQAAHALGLVMSLFVRPNLISMPRLAFHPSRDEVLEAIESFTAPAVSRFGDEEAVESALLTAARYRDVLSRQRLACKAAENRIRFSSEVMKRRAKELQAEPHGVFASASWLTAVSSRWMERTQRALSDLSELVAHGSGNVSLIAAHASLMTSRSQDRFSKRLGLLSAVFLAPSLVAAWLGATSATAGGLVGSLSLMVAAALVVALVLLVVERKGDSGGLPVNAWSRLVRARGRHQVIVVALLGLTTVALTGLGIWLLWFR